MSKLKYKIGDKVRIKSLDWYNENKDKDGEIVCGEFAFLEGMKKFCSETLTILEDVDDGYLMLEDYPGYVWTEEMIEGLVEEETKTLTTEKMDKVIEEAKTYWDSIKDAWICPQGYQFVDENGNVINAQKIVLEKKKKEYPKTYVECSDILSVYTDPDISGYKGELLWTFQKLLICRDAYWKIAGEEMRLGKPWKPSDSDYITGRYCIFVHQGNIICSTPAEDCPFTFPTEEMRDAFYENFKELIESCKELL